MQKIVVKTAILLIGALMFIAPVIGRVFIPSRNPGIAHRVFCRDAVRSGNIDSARSRCTAEELEKIAKSNSSN